MRECIYCGRILEKGEQCSCAMSVAKRKARENDSASAEKNANEEKQKKSRERAQAKAEKKNEKQREKAYKKRAETVFSSARNMNGNPFMNVWRMFVSFLRSPVETVMNPGEMTVFETMIFVVAEGIISGLSAFAIITGVGRGPFRLLGNIIGFGGVNGYRVLINWLLSALSGAVSGVIVFFIYSGIFYLVNRFIFKQFASYWQFARRFAFVAVPMSIIGAAGVILGIFSYTTFVILMLSGICGTLLITYEILRAVWHSKSTTKIIYTMMLCIFLFLTITMYLLRLSIPR